jgi:hypothetical protein
MLSENTSFSQHQLDIIAQEFRANVLMVKGCYTNIFIFIANLFDVAKVYNEYILASTSESILALERVFVNEYSFTARVYEYSITRILASIAPLYWYVDIKYMIYAIYMIDLGH